MNIDVIRKEEKNYHDFCYENHRLFEKGSWLFKPVKSILELLPMFERESGIKVLDLGAGVGRNSIPIAQAIKKNKGHVICVDLLDTAINKLKDYSKTYDVEDCIFPIKSDIGNFEIEENEYHVMIAVSSLEHVESEKVFDTVLKRMIAGTKINGVHALIINSQVQEYDKKTQQPVDVMMEVNIQTNVLLEKLNRTYSDWEILKRSVKPLEYTIVRNDTEIVLKTNAITYFVQRTNSVRR